MRREQELLGGELQRGLLVVVDEHGELGGGDLVLAQLQHRVGRAAPVAGHRPCWHPTAAVGAARHLPDVLAAVPCRNTGPQAAIGQLAYLPLFRPWYQVSLKSASFEAAPSGHQVPPVLDDLLGLVAGQVDLDRLLAVEPNGRTPACQR